MSRIIFAGLAFLEKVPVFIWASLWALPSLVYWMHQSDVPIVTYRSSLELSLVSAEATVNLSRLFDPLFLFLSIIVWLNIIKTLLVRIEFNTSDDKVGGFIGWWLALVASIFALVGAIYWIATGEALRSLPLIIIGLLVAAAYVSYQDGLWTGNSLARFFVIMIFSKRYPDEGPTYEESLRAAREEQAARTRAEFGQHIVLDIDGFPSTAAKPQAVQTPGGVCKPIGESEI